MSYAHQERPILTVDSSVLELAGGNLVLEENIEFSECAVLGLGKSEVAPSVAQEVGACVKETSLGPPVPAYGMSVYICHRVSIDEGVPRGEIMRGVMVCSTRPVRLYTNRPMTIVL